MSSTGRGGEREELDQYWTPQECADAIVTRLVQDKIIVPGMLTLEPSAGRGAFVSAMSRLGAPGEIDVCDLEWQPQMQVYEPVVASWHKQDFLTFEPPDYYDLNIGNPPFNEAEPHVRKALTLIDPDTGVLAFILRLSFLEGVERQAGFWKEHPCQYVYVLDKRPSFTKKRKQAKDKNGELLFNKNGSPKMVTVANDSASYAVFVWKNDEKPGVEIDLQSDAPMRVHAGHEPIVRFLSWKTEKKRAA